MRRYRFLAMMLVGWWLTRPALAVAFLPGPDVAIGDPTARVTAVDADGDGFDDLIAALPTRAAVAILWNQGLPTAEVGAPQLFAVGIDVARALVADFNGDGRADLAAAPTSTINQVAIRLSDGARSFAAPTTYNLPAGEASGWRCLAAVDVDGDTLLDLVVAERQSLVVLRGRGDGGFDAARIDGVPGGRVMELFVGDLDGQPGVDLLLGLDVGAQAWTNDGSGVFSPRPAFVSGVIESDVAAADVDGDGRLDVVATRLGVVALYRNDGSGQFSALPAAPGGVASPRQTAVHDVNRDGRSDLLSTTDGSELQVRYAVAGAGFSAPVSVSATPSPFTEIVLGDFNGDGERGDIAYELAADRLSIRVSAGVALLAPSEVLPVTPRPVDVALGDFDGDARPDVVSADRDGGGLSHYRNDGVGFSLRPMLVTGGAPIAVSAIDIDRDGFRDVVALLAGSGSGFDLAMPAVSSTPGELLVFHNARGSGFDPPRRLAVGQGPMGLAAADLNGDLRSDVVVLDRIAATATPYLAGSGDLVPLVPIALDLEPVDQVLADFDGDGMPDLAVLGRDALDAGGVRVYRGLGAGGFGPPSSLATGMGPTGVTSVDLDRDGLADLALLAGSSVQVARGLGAMAFQAWVTYPLDGAAVAIGRGFMNCDAAEDLLITAVSDVRGPELQVWLSEGNGEIAPPQRFSTGMGPSSVVAGNLDGVGGDDAVVAAADDDRVLVSRNSACPGAGSCDAPGLAIEVESPTCSGQGVRVLASTGYARYRWLGGGSEREHVVPSGPAGMALISLEAWDAMGCATHAAREYEVMPVPDIAAWAGQYYACAGADTPTVIPVFATASGVGGLTLTWTIDPPGSIGTSPGRSDSEAVFPADTPEGIYTVSVTATDGSGCSSSSFMTLRFLAGALSGNGGNSLRLARDGSGVVLHWDAPVGTLHSVYRGTSVDDVFEISGALETGVLADVPDDGSAWYYTVRPWSACDTGGSHP